MALSCQKAETTTLNDLPMELLVIILDHLTIDERKSLTKVCRQFRMIIQSTTRELFFCCEHYFYDLLIFDQSLYRIDFVYENDWTYSISSIIDHLITFGKGLRRLKANHISDEIDNFDLRFPLSWFEIESEKPILLPYRKSVPNFGRVIVEN